MGLLAPIFTAPATAQDDPPTTTEESTTEEPIRASIILNARNRLPTSAEKYEQ